MAARKDSLLLTATLVGLDKMESMDAKTNDKRVTYTLHALLRLPGRKPQQLAITLVEWEKLDGSFLEKAVLHEYDLMPVVLSILSLSARKGYYDNSPPNLSIQGTLLEVNGKPVPTNPSQNPEPPVSK